MTAFVISVYYGITCYYLTLIHTREQTYLDNYSLIGRRSQCYTNLVSFLIDSLSQNSNITVTGETTDAAWYYLEDCFVQEEHYKQMLLDGLTAEFGVDTFNDLNSRYEGNNMCAAVSQTIPGVNPLLAKNVTYAAC